MFGTRRTWVLGGRRYGIESATGEYVWHVDLSLNPPFCTCPQYSYRCRGTELCKHQVFFLAFGKWFEDERDGKRLPAPRSLDAVC